MPYTIGQLAKNTGTKSVTIRYYEKKGLLPPPQRSASGYRLYREQDQERLQFIRRGRALGFDLQTIEELLEIAASPNASCVPVDQVIERHLTQVRERMSDLAKLEIALLNMQCHQPDTVEHCQVIEALSSTKNIMQ